MKYKEKHRKKTLLGSYNDLHAAWQKQTLEKLFSDANIYFYNACNPLRLTYFQCVSLMFNNNVYSLL